MVIFSSLGGILGPSTWTLHALNRIVGRKQNFFILTFQARRNEALQVTNANKKKNYFY